MRREATTQAAPPIPEAPGGFSVVYGGPMMRLVSRLGIERPGRRAGVFILLTWMPLLVLSALTALRGGHELGLFLTDLPALARFVVAAPLLVLAEERIHRFTSQAVRQFASTGLIREADRGRFHAAIEEVSRGRESKIAEAVIVALAYVAAWIWFRNELSRGTEGWHARSDSSGLRFLPAGIWYVFASIPFYQFLIYRWIYRMLLWIRFLWRMSRLDLHLYPTHPDRAAGLGFLAQTQASFAPIVFATASVTSAVQFERILRHLTTLDSIQWPLLGLVIVVYPLLLLGPLVVFAAPLARVQREAELEYGALAMRYVRLFHEKWGPHRGSDETLLGSPDIRSLSDLQNAVSAALNMRLVPVTRNSAIALVLAGAIPFVPLVLTKIPLQTILKMVFKVAA